MNFNADAYVQALEVPSFTVGKRTYRGRLMSALEWQAFGRQFEAMEAGALTDDESRALVREFVEALFPAPPPQVTRHFFGLIKRPLPQITPADVFMAMPVPVQLEALKSFARCLTMTLPTSGSGAEDGSRGSDRRSRHRSGSSSLVS
jgi:hypothetical protein